MGRRQVAGQYLTPYKSDGVEQTPSPAGSGSLTGPGVFVLAAGTYYYELAGADANQIAAHIQWGTTFAGNARIEDTCLPTELASRYADGTTDGSWIDEDPTTAFVGTVGAGASVAAGVLTVAAGSQGGAMWQVELSAARRTRLKLVVGTEGAVRVCAWGKE